MIAHSLPILVAALAAFLIGALWYSPVLFAKAWVRANGYTPEKLAAMQANAGRAYAPYWDSCSDTLGPIQSRTVQGGDFTRGSASRFRSGLQPTSIRTSPQRRFSSTRGTSWCT
jgi:hypothetical protein